MPAPVLVKSPYPRSIDGLTVEMPGSVVPAAFADEYATRLANKICISSLGGKFTCSRKVTPDTGCGICSKCCTAEYDREGRVDGAAAAREDGLAFDTSDGRGC